MVEHSWRSQSAGSLAETVVKEVTYSSIASAEGGPAVSRLAMVEHSWRSQSAGSLAETVVKEVTYSSIAQWWSIRLLIEGFLVRVQVEEPTNPSRHVSGGFIYVESK